MKMKMKHQQKKNQEYKISQSKIPKQNVYEHEIVAKCLYFSYIQKIDWLMNTFIHYEFSWYFRKFVEEKWVNFLQIIKGNSWESCLYFKKFYQNI